MPDRSLTRVRPDGTAPAADRDDATSTTPADTRPDVFLSYSRQDQPFVLELASALEQAGWRVWVDAEDIPPAAEWRDELADGIRAAHTFVFVVSPDSVDSDVCLWELEQAGALGKRLIPVVIRPVDAAPQVLAERQYVFMRDEDDFDQAIEKLANALRTDLDWVKEHRQWLLDALRWDAHDRDRSLLVRGRDLKAAEAWLARQSERTEPRPTQLHNEFLLASRAWETRRLQITVAGVAVALAVATVLGVLALLQRNTARDQAAIARSRELALSSTSQLPLDPLRSLLLAKEAVEARATLEADNALRRAVLASRVRAVVPLQAQRVGGLVNAVAFSPDGKHVAAALKNGTVSVVSSTAPRGARASVLPLPDPSADDLCSQFTSAAGHVAVAFSPDGRLVAAVDDRAWIHVWRWPRPGTPATSPFCLGRTTPPTSTDLLTAVLGGSDPPVALTFVGSSTVAVAEADGRILRWSWAEGAPPTVQGPRRESILTGAFTPSARETVLADDTGITLVRSAGRPSKLPAGGVYAVAVSSDGSTVAAASGRRIVVWKPRSTTRPVVLSAPATIRAVATSGNGDVVAVGDIGRGIRVWDLSRGRRPVVLPGSEGAVTALAFSSDGQRLVSGGDDGVLRVWRWDASRAPSLPGTDVRPARFALSREGRLLALDPRDGRAAWLATSGPPRRLEGLLQPDAVSVSQDGRRAVAPVAPVTADAIQFWDLDGSPKPRTISAPSRLNAVALSADGRWLALAGRRFHVARWPGEEARELGPPQLLQYSAAAFADDGRRVAAAAYDGKNTTVFAWQIPAGGFGGRGPSPAPAHAFSARGFTHSLAFGPGGERLLAAQSDGSVRIWDLGGTSPPIVLRGHRDNVNSAAFSPEGNEVVSGGSDGTVRVWRLDRGAKSVAIPGPRHILAVAFTANGTEVTATGTSGSRVWKCTFCGSTNDVLAEAERLAVRSLTSDERTLFLHER